MERNHSSFFPSSLCQLIDITDSILRLIMLLVYLSSIPLFQAGSLAPSVFAITEIVTVAIQHAYFSPCMFV